MIQFIILQNLIHNRDYGRKVLPHLKSEYFDDEPMKIVFDAIYGFCTKYNKFPSVEAIALQISENREINPAAFDRLRGAAGQKGILDQLEEKPKEDSLQFLVEQTEEFCKDQAFMIAIIKAHDIAKDKKGKLKLSKGAVPEIFQKALAVSFDTRLGHDYLEDVEQRFSAYHVTGFRLPTNITYINKATRGGWAKKTLNIFMAGTAVGKSLTMVSLAAGHLMMGHNVLYLSGELAAMEQVGERVDANLLNVPIDQIVGLPKEVFMDKMKRLASQTKGKLIIEEYPAATASINDFRILLRELKIRKNFVPDVIFVDYINIFASCRIKTGGDNTNAYVKAVAEEMRGLAMEFDVPIVTATQTNRGGQNNSDLELTDIAESFGLAQTADLLIALMVDEDLEKKGQILMKQLKTRFGDKSKLPKWVCGIDKSKMKIFDVEDGAQKGYLHSVPEPKQKDHFQNNGKAQFSNFK